MKKIISLCVVLFCTYQISNAQTQKGSKNIGLFLDFEHSSKNTIANTSFGDATQTNTKTTFDIGPNFGYFICDGLELGGGLSYNTGKDNTVAGGVGGDLTSGQHGSGVGISAFFRKYVLYDNKIGFRIGPYVGYNYSSTTFTSTQVNTNNTGSNNYSYNAGASLDLIYYPSSKVGIAANLVGLNYSHNKSNDSIEHSNGENFTFQYASSGLYLSVFYVIGK
jgi:hypothetical protein